MREVDVILNVISAVKDMAKTLQSSTISFEDLQSLGEISPMVSNTIEKFLTIMGGSQVESRTIIIDGGKSITVTSEGRVFAHSDLSGELIPFWKDGVMRVNLPDGSVKRVPPIILQAFGHKATNPTGLRDPNLRFFVNYRNGDRRDLRLENLYWETGEDPVPANTYLIEDIARRIVEFNGDIDKVEKMYKDSQPRVSRSYIETLKKKQFKKELTDPFFKLDEAGNVIPTKDTDLDKSGVPGLDIYDFLIHTLDRKMTIALLKDKIKAKQNLSQQELEIIVISTMSEIGAVSAAHYISDIKDTFGLGISEAKILSILKMDNSPSAMKIFEIFEK